MKNYKEHVYDWVAAQQYYDKGHSIKECCVEFGFCSASWMKAKKRGDVHSERRIIPLEDLLVEGRNTNRTHLKNRLIDVGLLESVCSICGITEWLNNPLSLQVDHINGIGNDNRLENVRLLCPNCHSQTDTFAGRNVNQANRVNRKEEKFCIDCGTKINRNSQARCQVCAGKTLRRFKRPSKEDLTNLVIQLGYKSTGNKLGVSDNTIKKWLLNYGVSLGNRRGTLLKGKKTGPHGPSKLRKVGPDGTAWCSKCKMFQLKIKFYTSKSRWNGVSSLCKVHHLENTNARKKIVRAK